MLVHGWFISFTIMCTVCVLHTVYLAYKLYVHSVYVKPQFTAMFQVEQWIKPCTCRRWRAQYHVDVMNELVFQIILLNIGYIPNESK